MSTKTLRDDQHAKSVMFSQKCLGLVLKRVPEKKSPFGGGTEDEANGDEWMFESGYLIFQDFQEENRRCFWNGALVESVNNVEFMGFVAPGTLLIGGNEFYLEGLRSAWGRRVLRPPANYVIKRLGDVTGMDIQVIPQTQFTPLPEALCLVISELNQQGETASLEIIFSQLQERFCDMIVPNEDIIYNSLGKLIKDRKIYHTGDGYFIVTPETYRLTTASPLPERPILMTNEEAIHKLHGNELVSPQKPHVRSRSIQANMDTVVKERTLSPTKMERIGSMRLSRKDKSKSHDENTFNRCGSLRLSPERSKSMLKDINLKTSPVHQNIDKGEKVSVFYKLFRRSSSKRRKRSKSPSKLTFAAQFPPPEWNDPACIHYHSRATQTLEHRAAKDKLASNASLRSKTDSLTRLRDPERRHQRSRSSTLESSRDRQSRIETPSTQPASPVASRLPVKSSSLPRRVNANSTNSSPTKSPQQRPATPKIDRRHRRAESCTIVAPKASPEMPLNDDNTTRLRSDEEYRSSDPFGSSFGHIATLPRGKVAPYRIVSDGTTSKKPEETPLQPNNVSTTTLSTTPMNNKATVTCAPVTTPSSTPLRCINQLQSPSSAKMKEDNVSPLHKRLSVVSLSPTASVTDFEATYTSLAAQKILQGVSITSIDTLVEVNLAAEKSKVVPKALNTTEEMDRPETKELGVV